MKNLLIILTLLTITSCGPAAKLRRAERLIKKAELQGATWHVDTVYKDIPVFITETRVDSIIVSKPGDTVLITKDRLKLKYVRLGGDTVYIDAKCDADTIIVKVPVTVTKTIKANKRPTWWDLVILALVCLFIGWMMRSFGVKFK